MTKPKHPHPSPVDGAKKTRRGYIEGFYGRLLTWDDRHRILHHLNFLAMTDYFYAPKEDPQHRFQWRAPYDDHWRRSFQHFTSQARAYNITVSAGLAPGIDFDFTGLDVRQGDYAILLDKARQMIKDGADEIGLLMDDIDPGFPGHAGGFDHEGTAHTALANALAEDIDVPLHLTPRIYADIIKDDGRYLTHMTRHLNPSVQVMTCGHHIIAANTALSDTKIVQAGMAEDRLMVWDNLYAHDYCPRRLFLGAYIGRHDHQDIMLNPTGLVETDRLLLSLMAAGPDQWHATLKAHDVPDAFLDVAASFWLPPHRDLDDTAAAMGVQPPTADRFDMMAESLDQLLWRWKSPLQREWYPFLMGLRQDILLHRGVMSTRRISKTYPPLMATLLHPHAKPKT